jgi:hypothetical protein
VSARRTDSALDKKSPLHSVAQIQVPILLVYGNPSAASNARSLKMEAALRSAEPAAVTMSHGYAAAAKPQSVYDQRLMNGTHEQVQNIE